MSKALIQVLAWDELVGAVAFDPASGAFAFEYAETWRKTGRQLAPFMMPLESKRIFAFAALPPSFNGLPGLLADALPDSFGNALINAWMAKHGVRESEITPLDRLAYMGKRGLGALEFKPALAAAIESARPIEMKTVVEAARLAIRGDLSGGGKTSAALASIIRLGTSAGGARAKAVIAWNPATNEIRSGQFDVSPGFEHWILKFDGVGKDMALGTSADYGRIEYAYYLMATRAAGIEISPCRLLHEDGRSHFMTKRFDREENLKHHVQSLGALLHLDFQQRETNAYEQWFIAIKQLNLGDGALEQALRRMAFNVVARNCDDHVKNFGFRMKQGGTWELAPAYDITHAHNPGNLWTRQHLMSVNGKFDAIGRDDVLRVADRFAIPNAKKALGDVRAAIDNWREYALEAGLGPSSAEQVAADFSPI